MPVWISASVYTWKETRLMIVWTATMLIPDPSCGSVAEPNRFGVSRHLGAMRIRR